MYVRYPNLADTVASQSLQHQQQQHLFDEHEAANMLMSLSNQPISHQQSLQRGIPRGSPDDLHRNPAATFTPISPHPTIGGSTGSMMLLSSAAGAGGSPHPHWSKLDGKFGEEIVYPNGVMLIVGKLVR